MGRTTSASGSLPPWVAELGAPVWVSDPSGNIGYLNERAEKLLGISAEQAVGRPCHEIVAGRDDQGRPHCGPNCPVLACARRDRELEPFEVCVAAADGTVHWLQVLIIAIQEPESKRPWLVHCAILRDKAHRIEEYLSKVATRTEPKKTRRRARPHRGLTAREAEVLQLLAEDHSLYTIADELCISYVTVRNHVQHILAKLDAHSIMEAVARHLAQQKETGE